MTEVREGPSPGAAFVTLFEVCSLLPVAMILYIAFILRYYGVVVTIKRIFTYYCNIVPLKYYFLGPTLIAVVYITDVITLFKYVYLLLLLLYL